MHRYAPALPTPFDADDNIDYAVFEKFCGRQIQEGATALVVGGTTGEAPTLTPAEHRTLIRIQITVIAGAGTNSTAHAIELTKDAEARGTDAICQSCRTTTSRRKRACTRLSGGRQVNTRIASTTESPR